MPDSKITDGWWIIKIGMECGVVRVLNGLVCGWPIALTPETLIKYTAYEFIYKINVEQMAEDYVDSRGRMTMEDGKMIYYEPDGVTVRKIVEIKGKT